MGSYKAEMGTEKYQARGATPTLVVENVPSAAQSLFARVLRLDLGGPVTSALLREEPHAIKLPTNREGVHPTRVDSTRPPKEALSPRGRESRRGRERHCQRGRRTARQQKSLTLILQGDRQARPG